MATALLLIDWRPYKDLHHSSWQKTYVIGEGAGGAEPTHNIFILLMFEELAETSQC